MIPGILKEKTFAATANAPTHSLTHSLTQATRFQEPPSLTRSPIHSRAHGRFTCSFIYLKDSHSPSPCLDFHSTSLVKLLLLQQRAKSLTQLKPLISKHSGILLQKKSRKCTKCRIASHNRAGSPRKRTQRNTASSSLSSARTRKTEQLKKVETSWKKLKRDWDDLVAFLDIGYLSFPLTSLNHFRSGWLSYFQDLASSPFQYVARIE